MSITIKAIQEATADFYEITVADLKSPSRRKAFTHPRQLAMVLALKMTDSSRPDVGLRFGGRDHTTVMHAEKALEKRCRAKSETRNDMAAIERAVVLNDIGPAFASTRSGPVFKSTRGRV